MIFVKLKGQYDYFEWDESRMRLYNYFCGYQDIDENSEGWMYAGVVKAEDWHDLYRKTGYCPLYATPYESELWVDPYGTCYLGEAHEVAAKDIGEILYGVEDYSGDALIAEGWIKLTVYGMLTYYVDYGMYDHITMEQEQVIRQWANIHGVKEFEDMEWL